MGKRKKKKTKPKRAIWYKHKGIRRGDKRLHTHPSHPYPHPRGRWHLFPPTSRIPDRKGKDFRHTPQERRRTNVKGSPSSRRGRRKSWD